MKKICVTGAYGFIGKSICEFLAHSNISVTGLVRDLNSSKNSSNIDYIPVGDISFNTNLKKILIDTDCIIHCAGVAHVINEAKIDLFNIYQSANVNGTKQLANQAAEAGVKRLIFLSSIKVNGESTGNFDEPKIFTNDDTPNPQDNYSISKFEAEKVLWEIASKTKLEVVILRLPLVYGRDVKGNLRYLIKLINSKIPLPFANIKNKRSLIGIDNLVDVLKRCIENPIAAGKTFLVSDGEDLSTSELISFIALGMNRSVKLFYLPRALLKFFGFILMRQSQIDRLIGSLQIDNCYVKEILNWTPPISVEEGIRRMVQGK